MPTVYSTLWEVQLELGEIPDMISNNLLESCQDCHQQLPCEACASRASFQHAFSSYHTRWLNIDEPTLGAEEEEDEDFESDDESDHRPSLSTIFAGLSTSSIGSCDALQEGRAQYARLGPYPVYGSFDDDHMHCEVCHDRKDSGVFIHGHDECGHDEDHADAKATAY